MYVPTKDSTAFAWFIQKFTEYRYPLLLTGMPGSGKTKLLQYTQAVVSREVNLNFLVLNFNSKTTPEYTQLQIENKLQTQRRQGVNILMPPPGKRLIVLIDDCNITEVDRASGVQRPLELVRHLICYRNVFDRKSHTEKAVEETTLSLSCGPTGGSRNELPDRLISKLHLYVLTQKRELMSTVYTQMLRGQMRNMQFREEVLELVEGGIVETSISLYLAVSQAFKPTAPNPHYLFNLRDIHKIFQGMLMSNAATTTKAEQMAELWFHECSRVFRDKLSREEHRAEYDRLILQEIKHFTYSWVVTCLDNPKIYNNFEKEGVYRQAESINKLCQAIENIMNDFTKLHLVLFRSAIEHVTHITRVFALDQGNFLFIGESGSGKKSLTELGAAISRIKIVTF